MEATTKEEINALEQEIQEQGKLRAKRVKRAVNPAHESA